MQVARKRSGNALVSVLILSSLLLVVLLAFATSSVNNLTLTRQHVDSVRCDSLARAAVNEFLLQLNSRRVVDDATQIAPSIFSYFPHRHLLFDSDSRLQCRARVLTQGPRHSVDNSLSSLPAQSCFDQGESKSVPPFSVSLVIELEMGGRTFLYEAFVQQVWPYALTAPGPIRVFGRELGVEAEVWGPDGSYTYRRRALGGWKGTSVISGNVLASLADFARTPERLVEDPIEVSETFYSRLFAFSSGATSLNVTNDLPDKRVVVGGDFDVLNYRRRDRHITGDEGLSYDTKTWEAFTQNIRTVDALVDGRIDLYENVAALSERDLRSIPEVLVDAGSRHQGEIRRGQSLRGLDPNSEPSREQLARLFEPPDTSSWTRIQDAQLALLDGETTISSSQSRGGSRVITVPTGQVVYNGSIELGTSGSELPGLVLEDISLAVKGDLVLGPAPERNGADRPVLRGANATLVVEGSFIVDNGELDAGGNGMVIFCRDFVIKAKGRYNGLIVAQRGGAFVGSDPGDDSEILAGEDTSELVIRGGVIVGGRHLKVKGKPELVEGVLVPPGKFPTISLNSLAMISTRIEYDPKYLRTVNKFGNFQLVAVERRR